MKGDRKVLGKGLSALIGSDSSVVGTSNTDSDDKVMQLGVNSISPNPWQPRNEIDPLELEELKESIIEHGVVQPVVVRQAVDGRWELVAGERRLRASKLAGISTIPAIMMQLSDRQMLEIAVIENVQRQNLNPIDEAKAYKLLADLHSYTQEKIAKKVGKSRSHVANIMRLLALPEDVQEKLKKGEITVGHARPLIGRDDASIAAAKMVTDKMSVRSAEKEFYASGGDADDIKQVESALSRSLGMPVKIRDGQNGGSITINFLSLEELDKIASLLSGAQGM